MNIAINFKCKTCKIISHLYIKGKGPFSGVYDHINIDNLTDEIKNYLRERIREERYCDNGHRFWLSTYL